MNWSKSFTFQPWNNIHLGYDIIETSDGGYAFTGFSNDDIWFVKTDSLGNFPTYINEITKNSTLILYPNPTTGIVNIISEMELKEIFVYDLMGKEILRLDDREKDIDLENIESGVYYIKIIDEKDNTAIRKIIKN